jgi:hypothetical protein
VYKDFLPGRLLFAEFPHCIVNRLGTAIIVDEQNHGVLLLSRRIESFQFVSVILNEMAHPSCSALQFQNVARGS